MTGSSKLYNHSFDSSLQLYVSLNLVTSIRHAHKGFAFSYSFLNSSVWRDGLWREKTGNRAGQISGLLPQQCLRSSVFRNTKLSQSTPTSVKSALGCSSRYSPVIGSFTGIGPPGSCQNISSFGHRGYVHQDVNVVMCGGSVYLSDVVVMVHIRRQRFPTRTIVSRIISDCLYTLSYSVHLGPIAC